MPVVNSSVQVGLRKFLSGVGYPRTLEQPVPNGAVTGRFAVIIKNKVCLSQLVLCVVLVRPLFGGESIGLELPAKSDYYQIESRKLADFNSVFINKFVTAFEGSVENSFEGRFDEFHAAQWSIRFQRSEQELRDYVESKAFAQLSRGVEYSLRHAMADSPEVNRIIKAIEERAQWLGDLIYNSIAGDEQDLQFRDSFSLHNGYGLPNSGTNWEARVMQPKQYRIGVELFRPEPYIFVALRLRYQGQYLGMVTMRYRLQDFGGTHRFEALTLVPLAHHFALSVGFAYEVDQSRIRDVVRIQRRFKNGGGAFVGLAVNGSPAVSAGYSLPF